MTSTYFPQDPGTGGVICDPPMTRAALIALRNGNQLQKDCHYVINDYDLGDSTTVGPSSILLHAVDENTLSMSAFVATQHDNVAWDGVYDIDTNRIIKLTDNVENTVVGEDTVDAFPWGVAAVTRNYVSESTLNYIGGAFTRNRIEGAAVVTSDGTFQFNQVSGPVIVDAQGTSFIQNTVTGTANVTTSGNVNCANNQFTGQAQATFISGNNSDNEFGNDCIYNQVGTGTINLSKVGGGGNVVTNGDTTLSQCNLWSTAFNTTGSSGGFVGVDFTRSIINLTNVVTPLDFDDSQFFDTDLNGNDAQQITFTGVNTNGGADIDIGPGALLFCTQSTIENQGLLNVIAGRLDCNGSTIASQANVSVNSTSLIANILTDSIVQTGAVLQYLANSENCDVDRSIIQNQALVRFNTGAINSQLLTTTVDEAELTVTGTGDIRHSRLAGTVAIANQNMVLTNVQSEAGALNLLGSEGTIASSTFERNTVIIVNTPDVDISGLSMSSLATLAVSGATRLDLTNVVLTTNALVDCEPNTELDMDDCTVGDTGLIDVDSGILRVEKTQVFNGTIQNTTANAIQNVVTESVVNSNGLMRFLGTSNNCRIEFCQAITNGIMQFTGTSENGRISRCSTFGRNTNGRELSIDNSNDVDIISSVCGNDSIIEVIDSDGAQVNGCSSMGFSTLRLQNNTAVVSMNRCSAENNATLTLRNTAVIAGLVEAKMLNSFIATFDFTIAGNKFYQFGYGNGAVTQTDPPDGVQAQNW